MNEIVIEQKKGLLRNTLDKFYTKSTVAHQCGKWILEHIIVNKTDLVIEPSAGNGVFIPVIQSMTDNYKFYDIAPDHDDIVMQDYFTLDTTPLKQLGLTTPIHVIGNPPFGRQSSFAKRFIKQSCLFADSISFILPRSFKKHSMHKSFHRSFHLLFQIDIPDHSFIVNENEHDVPCVFQIWKRKATMRVEPIKEQPRLFTFVKKQDAPDISFRRVGFNAGDISTNIKAKSEQSHNFIKFDTTVDVDTFLQMYHDTKQNKNFEENNTVGPKSISKPQIVERFNILLK